MALALGELTDFHRKGESLREVRKAKLALETRDPSGETSTQSGIWGLSCEASDSLTLGASRRQATHSSWVKSVTPLLLFGDVLL